VTPQSEPNGLPGTDYRRIWLWLCVAWIVSSADRTITGPIVTWMLQNKVAFMATADPYAVGGLTLARFVCLLWVHEAARPQRAAGLT